MNSTVLPHDVEQRLRQIAGEQCVSIEALLRDAVTLLEKHYQGKPAIVEMSGS